MGMGRYLIKFAFAVFIFFALIQPSHGTAVISFADWQALQITRASNFLVRSKNQMILSSKRSDPEKLQKRYALEVQNAQQSLEVAKEFSIEDYLEQYIAKFDNPAGAVREVARHLSKQEVHGLILALLKAKIAQGEPRDENVALSHERTSKASNTP
jgi:hypothetical protein